MTRQPTSMEVHATVIRADGTREELGMVAYHHRNPLRRLFMRMRGVRGKIRRTA